MQTCCSLDELAAWFQTRTAMLKKQLVLNGRLTDVSCELMCTDLCAALGDIEGAVILMQAELARRKTALAKVKELASVVAESKERILHASSNLPDRLPSKTAPQAPVAPPELKEVPSINVPKMLNQPPKTPNQPSKRPRRPGPPGIEYLTVSEFTNVPKYMKGRILYDSLNATIDELNQVFSGKYKILTTARSAQSDYIRNKIQTYKEQETKDTKGLFFVVEADLKAFSRLKMDSTGRAHFTILRHCGRIREIRGKGLTRYTLCT